MLATTNVPGENPWYMDFSTTNHLTSDGGNITSNFGYSDDSSITLSSGEGINILNLIPTLIYVPIHNFLLNDICHVPLSIVPYFVKKKKE